MVDANRLAELSSVAQELNVRSNRLNNYIEQVNKALAKANVGIEYYSPRPLVTTGRRKGDGDVQPDYEQETFLGFDKIEDEWQLALKEVYTEYRYDHDAREEVPVTDETNTPLTDASRDLRLSAIEELDDLVEELTAAARRKLKVIERAEKLASGK